MDTAITSTSRRIVTRYVGHSRTGFVIRDERSGITWGWWASGPARMHLTSIGSAHRYTVFLENRGHRSFAPEANLPAEPNVPIEVAEALRQRLVTERPRVERTWVRHAIARDLVRPHADGRFVVVIAYPGTDGEYVRVIDTADLIPERVDLTDETVGIDADTTEIIITPDELPTECIRVPLPGVLFR